ncbi:unnamed protein product [Clonostachys byssicola]|uniref:Uncharacterized protein n=1 Tax=Clonostachys byssicola TaxID=160290 RepID=A0A9N9XXF8_9HYPO|nr:unnamed protein product [Clonostachys byssicola]
MANSPKSCLVTGCSEGGAGAALAEAFAKKGYHVFATARSPSKVPRSLHEASNVTVLALDITSSESIASAAEEVREKAAGKLDVLINNAGMGLSAPGLDTPMSDARKLFDINFFGVLEMVQVFGPLLVEAKGFIVNNSSVGGQLPLPFLSVYQATKAAIIQASEVWRLELAPLGVRVLTLLTGGIATHFVDNQPSPALPPNSYYLGVKDVIDEKPDNIRFAVSPETFANDVLRHVEKGTTGKLWIGGGAGLLRTLLWFSPQSLIDYLARGMKPFAEKLAAAHEKSA